MKKNINKVIEIAGSIVTALEKAIGYFFDLITDNILFAIIGWPIVTAAAGVIIALTVKWVLWVCKLFGLA